MRDRATAAKVAGAIALLVVVTASPVAAQECRSAVIFTTPGVTWEQVREVRPPNLLELAERGAVGSTAVRTNSSRTTYASGFATIGAGTRIDVPLGGGQPVIDQAGDGGEVRISGIDAIDKLATEQGYSLARPGAFGEAVSDAAGYGGGVAAVGNADVALVPRVPLAFQRYALLAAMDGEGTVRSAHTGTDLLETAPDAPFGVRTDPDALADALGEVMQGCFVAVVDQGDLVRSGQASAAATDPDDHEDARRAALMAADAALGEVMRSLDLSRDLLLVVSPTSPQWDEAVHFGIAVARGPGFEPGAELSSPSTRRDGMVTLPDVAPTVLDHVGIERPASMLGRAWFATGSGAPADRIGSAAHLDRETVFIDGIRTPVSTAFVLFQLLVYAVAVWVVARRAGHDLTRRSFVQMALQSAALFLAAFPLSTYVAGMIDGHPLGWVTYSALLVGITALIVVAVNIALATPLSRLLVVVGLTFGVLVVDLVLGAPLQLNTVFSYSPIVAGRFAGIGNIGFAILAASSVLTGALIVHKWGATRRTLGIVAVLFAVTVVVDGAPQFGSDVGGAIALVPGLGIAWLLIAGRRPTLRSMLVAAVAGVVVLAAFLAADLARPEASRTHLARLFEDVRSGGGQVLTDAIARKIRTNLRVLGSTIWTFVVPPALGLLAWLLLRPRWQWLSQTYPVVRAGLVAGLIMAVLGYAVNDSGIVIPAMMFSYLIPVAVAPLSEPRSGRGEEGA